jgi:hypothetical protein
VILQEELAVLTIPYPIAASEAELVAIVGLLTKVKLPVTQVAVILLSVELAWLTYTSAARMSPAATVVLFSFTEIVEILYPSVELP